MIIRDAVLETVCGITSRLPANTQPEFAFCGKSNVGKSSLINALMNRKSLARTSSTPGKTQTINYYHINDAFFYVDLPGYGFAKASEKVKAQWGKLIEDDPADHRHKGGQAEAVPGGKAALRSPKRIESGSRIPGDPILLGDKAGTG